ncbi:MAG TPA: hypothetical protein VFQ05_02330 [Candidatus Eisenbacteria bacterium]|nr:hypothetical protein [Candidatus Eisenbacteria bacterium]
MVVLTIIGLSLFSLSSYEAQFMRQSLENTQLFYDASGALDRARFLLSAPPKTLASVATNLSPGILYARAMQGVDSTGPVQWNTNESVTIRVLAERNGQRRMLEAAFDPSGAPQYENLFTMSATNRGLYLSQTSDKYAPNQNVRLMGTCWQNYNGTKPPDPQFDWYEDIYPILTSPPPVSDLDLKFGDVPAPQVAQFWNTNEAAAEWVEPDNQNDMTLNASGAPNGIKLFKTTWTSGEWTRDILAAHNVDITVSGIAVWMLDKGLYSKPMVIVHGTPNDMLVIVANKTNTTKSLDAGQTDVGLYFAGGFHSPDVPVILVTDGYVGIDDAPAPTVSPLNASVPWLTIYANFAWIHGPDAPPGQVYDFRHGPNSQADANLDKLLIAGLLPNAKRRGLALVPGSWRSITDSNPN